MLSSPDSMLILRVVFFPKLPTPHGKFFLSVCPCSQHSLLPASVFPAHTQHPYLPFLPWDFLSAFLTTVRKHLQATPGKCIHFSDPSNAQPPPKAFVPSCLGLSLGSDIWTASFLLLAASLLHSPGLVACPNSPLPLLQMSWGVAEPTALGSSHQNCSSFSDENLAKQPLFQKHK